MTDRELFARLIRCEAEGEGEAGMKGVASVVMNRVHVSGGEYLRTGQGNLRMVIEQPYQFTCLLTEVYGQVNPQNIYNIPAEQIHFEIAYWSCPRHIVRRCSMPVVLQSVQPTVNPYSRNGSGAISAGSPCFYEPTSLYYQTMTGALPEFNKE